MTLMIQPEPDWTTNILLANVLSHCKDGQSVQFLNDPRTAKDLIQRMRVALSRSRKRNERYGRMTERFTLCAETYPYTDESGKRHTCIVMWTKKGKHHRHREILDDLLERIP